MIERLEALKSIADTADRIAELDDKIQYAAQKESEGYVIKHVHFRGHKFRCRIALGPALVHEESHHYWWTNAGESFVSDVWIACKSVGIIDLDGLEVLITPEGVKFVFDEGAGSPSSLAWVTVRAPRV